MELTEPVQGVPQENLAGKNTTAHLIDPRIVEGHESRKGLTTSTHLARLDAVPEKRVLEDVLAVTPLRRVADELPCLAHDRAGRGCQLVCLLEPEENDRAEEVADGGQGEAQPKANEVLRVDHGERTSEGTSVDEKVEVNVDARCGSSGINDFLLSVLPGANIRLLMFVLFGDEGRDVRLETAGTDPHNDETNGENTHGDLGLDNDRRDS